MEYPLKTLKCNQGATPIFSMDVAYYIAKYTSKSESDKLNEEIREALNTIEDNPEAMNKKMFTILMKLMNDRQVSMVEAAYRLCHIPLRYSSRSVIFINTSPRDDRFRLIQVEKENPENNKYYSNIIEKYASRPNLLESLSLAEFACLYQPYYYKKNEELVPDEEDGDEEMGAEVNLSTSKILKTYTLNNKMGMIKNRGGAN